MKISQRFLNILFWILSFFLTVSLAYYQRLTGPTYPLKGVFSSKEIKAEYFFPRSCVIGEKCLIKIKAGKAEEVFLIWRRYKSHDDWRFERFSSKEGYFFSEIKTQPPAGKVEYKVRLKDENEKIFFITESSVISRFKGAVPQVILIPHIALMFLFMFFTVRIFLSLMQRGYSLKHTVVFNFIFLFFGGFVFGPLTQKYAFGCFWSGIPFGWDLTDNKTLLMLVFWGGALIASLKKKNEKIFITAAFLVTLAVYLIPHSLLGSEIDYNI